MPAGAENVNWIIELTKVGGVPALLIIYMVLKDRAFALAWTAQSEAVRTLAENVGRLAGKIERGP